MKSKEEHKSEAAKAPVAGSSVVQVVKKKSKNAAEQPPPKYEEIIISVGDIYLHAHIQGECERQAVRLPQAGLLPGGGPGLGSGGAGQPQGAAGPRCQGQPQI